MIQTVATPSIFVFMLDRDFDQIGRLATSGNLGSACKWCYKDIPLEDFCLAAKEIGLESVELLDPKDFSTVKKHGLHCAMVSYPTIEGPAA
jgi:hypothetical protein